MMRTGLIAAILGLIVVAAWQSPAIAAAAVGEGAIPGFQVGPVMDRVVPGEVIVDPPTLECLGFRWYISGDSNRNSSVRVAFRKTVQTDWRDGMPMLRVHHEVANRDYGPFRTGNLFAGSVMFLEPGTEYEVRLVMEDPDGGGPVEKVIKVATRCVPAMWTQGRKVDVVSGGDGKGTVPFSLRENRDSPLRENRDSPPVALEKALKAARAGDILLLHAGVYRGGFAARLKGTEKRPIVLRAAGDGEVVIEGTGHGADLIDLDGSEHVHIEGLTLRHARTAIRAGKKGQAGIVGLVVRRCKIYDVITGIFTYSENSRDWYLADNDLQGVNPTWYPRPGGNKYMQPSHTGINVYGRGHVVCYNRIRRFSDALAIANFGVPVDDLRRQCTAIDFYGNDLSFAQDDCLETDYGCHNIRVWGNRCYNAHTGLSVQPSYGGPIYLIRNEVYGVTALSFKLHNYCTGMVVYHNTCCSAGEGFRSFNRWQNGHFRNNLILGGDPVPDDAGNLPNVRAISTGTITPYSTLDYNGYRRNGPGRFILWYDGKRQASYETLAEFAAGTGHEAHGVMVDYDALVKATPPRPGVTVRPRQWDLRLRPSSTAVDRGCLLPNLGGSHTGAAPDLGCHELGTAPPQYGPREAVAVEGE